MALNQPKMGVQEAARRGIEAKALLHFACEVYAFQLAGAGIFFMSSRLERGPGWTSTWRRSW